MSEATKAHNDQFMTISEAEQLLRLSPAGLWLLRRRDGTFPQPFCFGPKTIRFRTSEIYAWIEKCRANDSK